MPRGDASKEIPVATAEGKHLFPFRTEKLSPPAPMVLPGRPGGRVGRCPFNLQKAPRPEGRGAFERKGAATYSPTKSPWQYHRRRRA